MPQALANTGIISATQFYCQGSEGASVQIQSEDKLKIFFLSFLIGIKKHNFKTKIFHDRESVKRRSTGYTYN
jgi:hypothetical protein